MVLSRFLAIVAACAILISMPAQATEVQEINQQFRKGDLPGALDRANRFLVKNPKDAQARFLKGLILADQGKTNDAITVFTGLTEDFPELPEPYNNLAVLYASQNKYDAAKNALEMAIRTPAKQLLLKPLRHRPKSPPSQLQWSPYSPSLRLQPLQQPAMRLNPQWLNGQRHGRHATSTPTWRLTPTTTRPTA